ncbi:MAG: flavodoxin family protein [Deltaproteobacteria bacterium]|jgi:multimeric flavodoxin WrbA|nr:flavodoxin family protein [Deltaproteobacteria bacterium]
MNMCILMGSPRKNGNTKSLLDPFMEECARQGNTTRLFWLYSLNIMPCTACRLCQKDWTRFGCRFDDDLPEIFDHILACDLLVLATPIYSWYCTAPMKALLDRLMYGMNKYYGEERGPSLWKGKPVAAISTCGYEAEKGADLFEQGLKRYCKHSQLHYLGMHTERDWGYKHVFMSEDKAERATAFARTLQESVCRVAQGSDSR